MPRWIGGNRRSMSPSRLSIFTTSAPRSPRMRPHIGPATTVVRSRTFSPRHGPDMAVTSGGLLLHHVDHAGALSARAAEQLGVGASPLVVEMVRHLPGEADSAEDLNAAVRR